MPKKAHIQKTQRKMMIARFVSSLLMAYTAAASAAIAASADGASAYMTSPKASPKAFPNSTIDKLHGTFYQTYSNMYVQSTTEIDWKCIKVYVDSLENPPRIVFHKTASLHGGPLNVTTPTVEAKILDNAFSIPSSGLTKIYDIHDYSTNTLVITGRDTPALYVWNRQGSHDDEPVDIPRLLVYMHDIDFRVHDPFYSKIVLTYDDEQC